MEIPFTPDETALLQRGLKNRPQFQTVEEFVRAHCQGAIDACRAELKTVVLDKATHEDLAELELKIQAREEGGGV